jgi:pyrroloquinoline quinone biosynthesis protein B
MGHVSGLVHLGPESLNARSLPLFATRRLHDWLESGPPWKPLLKYEHIIQKELHLDRSLQLTPELHLKPIQVPHRDEHAETLAFRIEGPNHSALYLPDIDRWKTLHPSIMDLIHQVDRAYLDGTFYDAGELPGRPLSEIPHPTLLESITEFSPLDTELRSRIHFLHLNHTNPVLDPQSSAFKTLHEEGFELAQEGETFSL